MEIVCRRRIVVAHALRRRPGHDGKEGLVAGPAHALAARGRAPGHVRAVTQACQPSAHRSAAEQSSPLGLPLSLPDRRLHRGWRAER